MSSNQDLHYRAGETKGRTEEKTSQMMDNAKVGRDKAYDSAQQAKDKAYDSAQQAKDKTYDMAQEAKDKTSQTAQEAKDRSYDMAQQAKDKTNQDKDQTGTQKSGGGALQQTGEKVKQMAAGAADAVKHTFGMGSEEDKDQDTTDPTNYNRRNY